MMDISLGGAVIAGLLSFASPCVLPLAPPYLAWLAGVSFDEYRSSNASATSVVRLRVLSSAFAFVLGFTTVFVSLGATTSVFGQVVVKYFDTLALFAGAIVIAMGLHFLGVCRLSVLYKEARFHRIARPAGLLGAYTVGLAFAFGWTPCVGPVLAAILLVASSESSAMRGASLLAAYSFGIGLPFLIAAALANQFSSLATRLQKHMPKIEIATGTLLVITGLAFMTGQMRTVAEWLLQAFPQLERFG